MATKKEVKDYIVDQLVSVGDITIKPMLGEYLLYLAGKLFGGIYDDRLLIKMNQHNAKFNLPTAIPYAGAKPMYQIVDIDDSEKMAEIILVTCHYNDKGE